MIKTWKIFRNFRFSFHRERLTEIHDEYEEREQRWSRIAILLNRDELGSLATITSPVMSNVATLTYRGRDSPRLRSQS